MGKGQTDWFPPCLLHPSLSACTYRNQECRLTIHYDNGFSISTEPQDGAFPKTIIQSPYEKLKMSSDDGIRMLYLDFGGKEGEIVSVLFLWPHDFTSCSKYHICDGLEVVGCLITYLIHSTDIHNIHVLYWMYYTEYSGGRVLFAVGSWESGIEFRGFKQIRLSPVPSFGFIFSLENDINIWI